MKLVRHTSENELIECVNLYIKFDEGTILKMNADAALANLVKYIRNDSFFRVIKDDAEKIRGWILASVTDSEFAYERRLEQRFYVSNFEGFQAARAVILSHEALIVEAKRRRLSLVQSHASHLDPEFILCKILAKKGWETQGFLAQYHIK